MARVIAACLDVMDRPWQWGAADCCTAACDVFIALHGIDPMARLRGRYDSRMGALRMIAAQGGWHRMAGGLARDAGLVDGNGGEGEIGLIVSDGNLCLGVSTGAVWIGKSLNGFSSVPNCVRSWRVA